MYFLGGSRVKCKQQQQQQQCLSWECDKAGRKNRYVLLDIKACSMAVYFYESCILVSPQGKAKTKNVFHTLKYLICYCYTTVSIVNFACYRFSCNADTWTPDIWNTFSRKTTTTQTLSNSTLTETLNLTRQPTTRLLSQQRLYLTSKVLLRL